MAVAAVAQSVGERRRRQEEGREDEPTSDGERPANKTNQDTTRWQAYAGAQIRFAVLFERHVGIATTKTNECQEQQAEDEAGPMKTALSTIQ